MCETCLVKAKVWLNALPGWNLIQATEDGHEMDAGDWGLVEGNGPSVVWQVTPERDPTKGMEDLAADDYYRNHHAEMVIYNNNGQQFVDELICDPGTGHRLVEACKLRGFVVGEINLGWWLFDYLGTFIAQHRFVMDQET